MLSSLTGSERVSEKAHLESKRWQLYQQALTLAGEQPVSGVGYGNFEPSYVRSCRSVCKWEVRIPRTDKLYPRPQWSLAVVYRRGHFRLGWHGYNVDSDLNVVLEACHTKRARLLVFLDPIGLAFSDRIPVPAVYGPRLATDRWGLLHDIQGAQCFTFSRPCRSCRAVVVSILWLAIPVFALNNLNTIYWTREINKHLLKTRLWLLKFCCPAL